jgi:site-specific DNA recombinase
MDGYPVLSYDPDPGHTRLVVNEAEAEQVRGIFSLFLRQRALIPALEEIRSRGWRLKSWTTRAKANTTLGSRLIAARWRGCSPTCSTWVRVSYQGKVYPGEQPAIVEAKVWKKANELLQKQARGGDGR